MAVPQGCTITLDDTPPDPKNSIFTGEKVSQVWKGERTYVQVIHCKKSHKAAEESWKTTLLHGADVGESNHPSALLLGPVLWLTLRS